MRGVGVFVLPSDTSAEQSLRRIRHLNWCRIAHARGRLDDDQIACEEVEFEECDPYRRSIEPAAKGGA